MAEKIVFLGMGGTIAGTASTAGDNVGYTAAQVGVEALLQSVPGLAERLGARSALSEQVCQIDSKDLTHADWLALKMRAEHYLAMPDVCGIVVTHGTDTLEETAFFLSQVLPEHMLKKPLVLTCAMRPASSLAPDGPFNMADAASVANWPGACGVLVVCAGKVHSAAHVQKVHPYQVDAFDSGEAGPIALVEEGQVRMLGCWPAAPSGHSAIQWDKLPAIAWPRVEVVLSHGGASGALLRSLLRASPGDAPVEGVVIAGTGNGTIHREMEAVLREAQAQGVRVVRVSRCACGAVVGASTASRSAEFEAWGYSAVKARVALMLSIVAARPAR